MASEVNQEERAYNAWNVLTEYAALNKTITYKELADKVGVYHRVTRYFLGLIQDYCMDEKLPPLSIIVVNQSGIPGDGFIAWDIEDFDHGKQIVFNFNWKSRINPFSYACKGNTKLDLVNRLVESNKFSEEVYSLVKDRGVAQTIFREALILTYNSRCAFCGIRVPELLEAAHIVPWSQSSKKQRMDIKNGLLLCSNHHKMFDRGLICVNEDYSINFSEQFEKKYEGSKILNLKGKKIRSPRNKHHRPSLEYLQWHREIIFN